MKIIVFIFIIFQCFEYSFANELPLGVNTCEFNYLKLKFKKTYPEAFKQVDDNLQEHIWRLRSEGKFDEASRLEEEVKIMLNSEFHSPADVTGGSAGGARFYNFDLRVIGVGKKTGRHWSTSVEAEVSAFRIDRLYEFDFTPVTISRNAEGGFVSMQLFFKDAKAARYSKIAPVESDIQKLKVFDYLIDNFDRRNVNYLVTKDGRIVAIDHGVSFHNTRSNPHSPPAPKLEEIDLNFFTTAEGKKILNNLRQVDDSKIHSELLGLIPETHIGKFIERKNKLLEKLNLSNMFFAF